MPSKQHSSSGQLARHSLGAVSAGIGPRATAVVSCMVTSPPLLQYYRGKASGQILLPQPGSGGICVRRAGTECRPGQARKRPDSAGGGGPQNEIAALRFNGAWLSARHRIRSELNGFGVYTRAGGHQMQSVVGSPWAMQEDRDAHSLAAGIHV